MLPPKTLGRIAVGVAVFCCLTAAFLLALGVSRHTMYQGPKAIAFAVMGAVFAVLYRYVKH